MTLTDVLEHFKVKPSELAEKLGVTPGAISQWKDGIPEGRQWQIQLMTDGALKASKRSHQSAA
ncbi:hypothetical protein AWH63_06675 [Marinobacter sp. C18]|uniref:Cro/CI family transcriptional regulator n=1 Tax=Marinobacter sp. C18 TaxID=1772288 RepID=UPI000948CE30|nr:Cro/CI family transcriptional regulator [Marinobacter sp. C18]OLF82683.1 hypothetical protein AWH63_06675 [Marinobacter sp. C18]